VAFVYPSYKPGCVVRPFVVRPFVEGGVMLQVSETAIALLKNRLESQESSGNVFRLVPQENSFALTRVASPEEGDVVYEKEGEPVLSAPSELADHLADQKIDVEETGGGARLVVVDQ
jgi:hypothetical protein